MIVVEVWIYPGGDKTKKRINSVICIANDGTGSAKFGNYEYAVSHTGKYLAKYVGKKKDSTWKSGKIRNFKRSGGVYRLLAKILKDAGQT